MICWFGNLSMVNKNRLGKIVKLCQETIGTNFNDPAMFIKLEPLRGQRPFWPSLNTLFMQSLHSCHQWGGTLSLGGPNSTDVWDHLFPWLWGFKTSCRPRCYRTHTLTKDWWTPSAFIAHCNFMKMTYTVCYEYLCFCLSILRCVLVVLTTICKPNCPSGTIKTIQSIIQSICECMTNSKNVRMTSY